MRRFDERMSRLTTGIGAPAQGLPQRPDDGEEPWDDRERPRGWPRKGKGQEIETNLRKQLSLRRLWPSLILTCEFRGSLSDGA